MPVEAQANPGELVRALFPGMLALVGILVAVTGIFIAEYHTIGAADAAAQSRFKRLVKAAAALTVSAAVVTIILLSVVAALELGGSIDEWAAKTLAGGVAAVVFALAAVVVWATSLLR